MPDNVQYEPEIVGYRVRCDACSACGPIGTKSYTRCGVPTAHHLALEAGWREHSFGVLTAMLCPDCFAEQQQLDAESIEEGVNRRLAEMAKGVA